MDPTEFGDPIQFPVLKSLGKIFEENGDLRMRRRAANLLIDFRRGVSEIKKINSPFRKKVLHLWREYNRGKITVSKIFSPVVKTHIDNFMVAIIRNETKK